MMGTVSFGSNSTELAEATRVFLLCFRGGSISDNLLSLADEVIE